MNSEVLTTPRAGLPLLLSRKQMQLPPQKLSIRFEYDPSVDGCRELVMDDGRTFDPGRRFSTFAKTNGNTYTSSTTGPTGASDDSVMDPSNDLADEF